MIPPSVVPNPGCIFISLIVTKLQRQPVIKSLCGFLVYRRWRSCQVQRAGGPLFSWCGNNRWFFLDRENSKRTKICHCRPDLPYSLGTVVSVSIRVKPICGFADIYHDISLPTYLPSPADFFCLLVAVWFLHKCQIQYSFFYLAALSFNTRSGNRFVWSTLVTFLRHCSALI